MDTGIWREAGWHSAAITHLEAVLGSQEAFQMQPGAASGLCWCFLVVSRRFLRNGKVRVAMRNKKWSLCMGGMDG